MHAILEEAPDHAGTPLELNGTWDSANTHNIHRRKVYCLSANDSDGIDRQARLLVEYLQCHARTELMDDLAYTLGQRRSIHRYKVAIQSGSIQELKMSLEGLKRNATKASAITRLAFIFTGQGAQWPKMGHELLGTYPVFKNVFEAADKHMSSLGATWSLLGMFRDLSFMLIFFNSKRRCPSPRGC